MIHFIIRVTPLKKKLATSQTTTIGEENGLYIIVYDGFVRTRYDDDNLSSHSHKGVYTYIYVFYVYLVIWRICL